MPAHSGHSLCVPSGEENVVLGKDQRVGYGRVRRGSPEAGQSLLGTRRWCGHRCPGPGAAGKSEQVTRGAPHASHQARLQPGK